MVRIIRTSDLAVDYRGEDGADGWCYEEITLPTPKPSRPAPQSVEQHVPFKLVGGKPISKKGLL